MMNRPLFSPANQVATPTTTPKHTFNSDVKENPMEESKNTITEEFPASDGILISRNKLIMFISGDLCSRFFAENSRLGRERSWLKSLEVKSSEKTLPLCHKIWIVDAIRQLVDDVDSVDNLLHEYYKIYQSFLVDGRQSCAFRHQDAAGDNLSCEHFLWYLRLCPPRDLLPILVVIEDGRVLWEALFSSVYGSAFFADDEQLILDTLIAMIEAKDNRLGLSIDTLIELYITTSRPVRAFLRSTLHQPVMHVLGEDEWFLDTDTALLLSRFSESERLRRFGRPSNTADYTARLSAYQNIINTRLISLTQPFVDHIHRHIVTIPQGLRCLVMCFVNELECTAAAAFVERIVKVALDNAVHCGILSSDESNAFATDSNDEDDGTAISEIALYNLKQVGRALVSMYDEKQMSSVTTASTLEPLKQRASELNSHITNHLYPQKNLMASSIGVVGDDLTRQYILSSFDQLKTIITLLGKAVRAVMGSVAQSSKTDPFLENMQSALMMLEQSVSPSNTTNVNYMDERVAVMYFTSGASDSNSMTLRGDAKKYSGPQPRSSPDLERKHSRAADQSDVQSMMTDTVTVASNYTRIGFSVTTTRSVTPLSHDYANSEYSTGQLSLPSSGESNEDADIATTPSIDHQVSSLAATHSVSSMGLMDEAQHTSGFQSQSAQIRHRPPPNSFLLKSNLNEVTDRFNMFDLHDSSSSSPRAKATSTTGPNTTSTTTTGNNNSSSIGHRSAASDDARSSVSENWSTIAGASEYDPCELENRLCDVIEDNPMVQDLMTMHPRNTRRTTESDCWSIEPTPSETDATISLMDVVDDSADPIATDRTSSSSIGQSWNPASLQDDHGHMSVSIDQQQPVCGFDIAFPRISPESPTTIAHPTRSLPEYSDETKSFSAIKDILKTIFIRSDLSVLKIAQQVDNEIIYNQATTPRSSIESLLTLLKAQYSQHVITGDARTQRKLSEAMNSVGQLAPERCNSLLNMVLEICRTCRTLFLNSSTRQEALILQIQRLDDLAPCVDKQMQVAIRMLLHQMGDLLIKRQNLTEPNNLVAQVSSNRSIRERCSLIKASLTKFQTMLDRFPSEFANETSEKQMISLHIERRLFGSIYLMLMFPDGVHSTDPDRFFGSIVSRHRDSLLSRLRKCSMEAIDELALLNAYKTPHDKLNCFSKVLTKLSSNNRRRVAWRHNVDQEQSQHQPQAISSQQQHLLQFNNRKSISINPTQQDQQHSASVNVPSISSSVHRNHYLAYAIVKVNPPYFLCNVRFIKNYFSGSVQENNDHIIHESVLKVFDAAINIIRSYSRDDLRL